MAARRRSTDEMNFEEALKQLEVIVKQLEEDEVPLELSLKLFGEGRRLMQACEEKLKAAENQVRVLIENQSGEIEETELEEQAGGGETERPVPMDEPERPGPPVGGGAARDPAGARSADEDDLPF